MKTAITIISIVSIVIIALAVISRRNDDSKSGAPI